MTTTPMTPIPTASLSDALATAAELRQMADLLDRQGEIVRFEGTETIGTLESVYFSEGVAVNVIGLIDWSKNGKAFGHDFTLGPLYGATLVPCPSPWVGYDAQGNAIRVFASRATATARLGRPSEKGGPVVVSVAPFHQ